MMKRMMYIGSAILLCRLAGLGASKATLGFTGSTDLAALVAIAAFIGNFFMIEPIRHHLVARDRSPAPMTELIGQQRCRAKLCQLTTGAAEMTEYVITEASLHQWLVFADRKCIASCADEVEAEKAMLEHSARAARSPEHKPMSMALPAPAAAP
jgi:hypothetical protein